MEIKKSSGHCDEVWLVARVIYVKESDCSKNTEAIVVHKGAHFENPGGLYVIGVGNMDLGREIVNINFQDWRTDHLAKSWTVQEVNVRCILGGLHYIVRCSLEGGIESVHNA